MTPRDTALTVERVRASGVVRELPEVVGAPGTLLECTFLADSDVSATVVAVAPPREAEDGLQPRAGTVDAAARYGIDLAELSDRAGGAAFRGVAGQVAVVDLPRTHGAGRLPWDGLPQRIVLLGIGGGTTTDLRRAGAALAGATRGLARVVSAATAGAGTRGVRAFVEGYLLAAYRPPRLTGPAPVSSGETATQDPAEQLVLLGNDVPDTIAEAARAARATWLVRDLANTPSNIKDPAWFARRAVALADAAGLSTSVLGPRELAAQGFGGILAVGAGSASPPRLATITYEPVDAAPGARHVVIVGKGITYDTGGLSIKPREAMVPMKTDMAGAAVALATVLAAADAGVRHRVTAVLPLAENHVGAASYRPGDVLRLHSGRSVEIANTDAEGRIVLADALSYAVSELEPDLLVDVATLTGAASLGLGRGHGALYGTDEPLLAVLEEASASTGEQLWRMPLVEDYTDALRSTVADLRHVPLEPQGGGSITAALFLREFTDGVAWAHLDIAGPARATSNRHEVTEGATGFGARLLLRFLADLD
ncbi:leucyl aminopeptidase family protein [Oerskovia flava]|uniref:leucyl aminopeptidase family protein n=1 Tax=Oerskovia flava TaxID=2986422 RepID=UPI002240DA32|nr:M17 family metallopeptidase [Oerskovia sp. JB1-3-2]